MKWNRASAVIIHDDKLLVIYRQAGGRTYYALPGGRIEKGETFIETIKRELIEETSLDTKLDRQIYQLDAENGFSEYTFLAHYISGEPELHPQSEEKIHESATDLHKPMWLPIKDLPGVTFYPQAVKEWLLKDIKEGFPKDLRQTTIKSWN